MRTSSKKICIHYIEYLLEDVLDTLLDKLCPSILDDDSQVPSNLNKHELCTALCWDVKCETTNHMHQTQQPRHVSVSVSRRQHLSVATSTINIFLLTLCDTRYPYRLRLPACIPFQPPVVFQRPCITRITSVAVFHHNGILTIRIVEVITSQNPIHT